ncbi:MAG: hypothetical protein JW850_13245 [Thermoflexales bacterium]|nr:hypothetical protein [Thermoflexales bacterium]
MLVSQMLNEVVTLAEAVDLAERLGHPLDRANLMRYAQAGRLTARKSKGTWLTTRGAVCDLVVALDAESRGRPRHVKIDRLAVTYNRTPELLASLKRIQEARQALRGRALPPAREAELWDQLTTEAIYHTHRLEGNSLTFEEAQAVIEAQKTAPARSDQTVQSQKS